MFFDLITFLICGILFLGVIVAGYYSYRGYCILVEIKELLNKKE